MFTNEEMDFLRQLQKQMQYEEEHDNDCQASPRFWTIMDYRKVPTHEDYGLEFYEYIYNDGDVVEFDDKFELIDFLEEYFEGKMPKVIQDDLNACRNDDKTFDDVWNMVMDSLQDSYTPLKSLSVYSIYSSEDLQLWNNSWRVLQKHSFSDYRYLELTISLIILIKKSYLNYRKTNWDKFTSTLNSIHLLMPIKLVPTKDNITDLVDRFTMHSTRRRKNP